MDNIYQILSSYFPTKRAFDVSLQNLKAIGLVALNDEDKEIINQSNLIRGKRYQTTEEKELIKTRKKIAKRIDRTIARLRHEMFPEPINLSDISFCSEVSLNKKFISPIFKFIFSLRLSHPSNPLLSRMMRRMTIQMMIPSMMEFQKFLSKRLFHIFSLN